MPALLESGKIGIDAVEVACHRVPVLAGIGADAQVFVGGEIEKSAAAVGHVRNSQPRNRLGGQGLDRPPIEAHRPLSPHHAAHGAQQRGLAGTVGAEDSRDAILLDGESHAAQNVGGAVTGVQTGNLE